MEISLKTDWISFLNLCYYVLYYASSAMTLQDKQNSYNLKHALKESQEEFDFCACDRYSSQECISQFAVSSNISFSSHLKFTSKDVDKLYFNYLHWKYVLKVDVS